MNTEKWLYALAIAALIGIIIFAKGKVCVGTISGDARSVASWLWPCASDEKAITS